MDVTEVRDSNKDSGYLTCFEDLFCAELTLNDDKKKFDEYSEEKDSFENAEFMEILDEEASRFIKQPNSRNIFYPNLKNVQQSLFKNKYLPCLQTSLRNSLESEMSKEDQRKIFSTNTSISQSINHCGGSFDTEAQSVSPDLFCTSSSEDEKMPDCQSVVEKANSLTPKTDLIADAEKFMIQLLKDLVENGAANISVVDCNNWHNSKTSDGILTHKDRSELIHRNVNLQYSQSRYHFAMIIYILSEIYHLLITGSTCTERELFYNDLEFVKSQANIKSVVKDVCSILNASPWELGIRQSSKGLIAGAIKIHMPDNIVIDCYMYDRATLIPNDVQAITFLETTAKFVLIIEKDTVFEKFVLQNILLSLNEDIILITGRGYPDIGTRLMVKRIWNDFRLPIYALVDADPFGIDILFVYRYGSKAMAFSADHLACPPICWIGLEPSEIETLAIPSTALSKADKKKINELLQRNYISAEMRNELEMLQRLGRKAEIEGAASFSTNFLVCDYIPNKIKRKLNA